VQLKSYRVSNSDLIRVCSKKLYLHNLGSHGKDLEGCGLLKVTRQGELGSIGGITRGRGMQWRD